MSKYKASQLDLKKVDIALMGLSTIVSPFKLNEVFKIAGIFVLL